MATTTTSSISTTNVYLSALLHESARSGDTEYVVRWTGGPVSYYLAPGDYDQNGMNDWSENGAGTAIRKAFAAWQAVSGITFAETTDGNDANLIERISGADGNLGTHHYPQRGNVSVGNYNERASVYNDGSNNAVGSFSFTTFIHELGHAIGLDHSHEGFAGVDNASDTGDNGLNQQIFSVMSYNRGWDGDGGDPTTNNGWVAGPMAFDIAAVQLIYGRNMTTATGNNVYVLPSANQMGTSYSCIWDAGGIDTISAGANASGAVTINLNDATLRNEAGGGGFVSRQFGIFGGFTIANGVVIENAIGGTGNDTLVGNEYSNGLLGGVGDDALYGGAGHDRLAGGAGADVLVGGNGNDTYDLGSDLDSADTITEIAGQGIDAITTLITRSLDSSEYAAIDTLVLVGTAAIDGTGNALSNVLTGNGASNALIGGGGNDSLRGGGGADVLTGGGGNDRLVFGLASESPLSARDKVLDFDDRGDDLIDLSLFLGAAQLHWQGTLAFTGTNQVRVSQSGADVLVSLNLDGNLATTEMQIVLHATALGSITQSDFLL